MRLARGVLTLGLVGVLTACSGGDEPEEPAGEPSEGGDTAAEPPADEPAAEEEPAAEPAEVAAEPAPAPAPAEPPGFTGAKVPRYVTSYALNVRTGPGKDFPVKRHVKRGDKIDVVINGDWAKLDSGEYVSTNRLSANPPKH